jgi:AcrR family transcriptional regulator
VLYIITKYKLAKDNNTIDRKCRIIMKKQKDITDKTRQAFIDTFCQLYSQKPLDKISVQEITRKAGYNRSTFYQYFFDINDLLSTVEQELLDDIVKKRSQAGKSGRSFVEDLVELYEEKELYLEALLGDYGNNHFLKQIISLPNIDIPELNFPDDHKLKPYLIEYRLSGSLALFRLWLRRGKDLSAEEFISLVAELYQDGMEAFYVTRYNKQNGEGKS